MFPALGCTEPTAVAYAASAAGKQLEGDITEVHISVHPGVYKNGFSVAIPNTDGERGNLIAGVLGALIQRPDLRMDIMIEKSSGRTDPTGSMIRNKPDQRSQNRSVAGSDA